jgi:Asp/Glu/hydantoin racemase
MYKIALIHTVKSVLMTFEYMVKEAIEDVKIVNTLDEFLALDPADVGEFTVDNMNRLFMIVKCAETAKSDAIVVTCSTLTPTVQKIKDFVKIPVITIDEAMIKKAVNIGGKITVMATAESTIGPTKSFLTNEAEKAGKKLDISVIVCPDAIKALKAGDKDYHDKVLKNKALEIKGQDAVILAQASMAHLEQDIENICGCKVLSSPKLCIEQLKETLYNIKK